MSTTSTIVILVENEIGEPISNIHGWLFKITKKTKKKKKKKKKEEINNQSIVYLNHLPLSS